MSDGTIDVHALAKLLNLDIRRIQQLAAEGHVFKAERGRYHLARSINGYCKFMQKANDGEKATLRLEVEKLRRGEHEWLNVIVFMLDHIFALNRAAERSGQENLIKQLGHFQNTCRDAARRVGLAPVLAAAGEAFDPQKHQLPEGEVPAGGVIGEIVASGYSYQGKLIRSVIVTLQETPAPAEQGKVATGSGLSQLPLGATESPAV